MILLTLPFTPAEASTLSAHTDALYTFLVLLTVFITAGIAGLEIYFFVKYLRRNPMEVPSPVRTSLKLEVLWTVIPFCICLFIFISDEMMPVVKLLFLITSVVSWIFFEYKSHAYFLSVYRQWDNKGLEK